jgi:hypothetical protein
VGRNGLISRLHLRRLLADVLAEAAADLLKKHSIKDMGILLFRSLLHDPIPAERRVLRMAISRVGA